MNVLLFQSYVLISVINVFRLNRMCFSLDSYQLYLPSQSRILTQLQAVFTQFIYERALLTRMAGGGTPQSTASSSNPSKDSTKDFSGRLHNLISSDIDNFTLARDPLLYLVLFGPLKTILSTIFLYQILGVR